MKSQNYSYLQFVHFMDVEEWSVQFMQERLIKYNNVFPLVEIGKFLLRNKKSVEVKDNVLYKRPTIKINNGGICLRNIKIGKDIGTKKQFLIKEGQFLLSKIDARNGAFGVVPKDCDNGIITGNFWTFDVDYTQINPYFLSLVTTTKDFINFAERASNGTTNRHYLQEDKFLKEKIPLPSVEMQNFLISAYNTKIQKAEELEELISVIDNSSEKYLLRILGIELPIAQECNSVNGYLQKVRFKDVAEWGIDKVKNYQLIKSTYNIYKIKDLKNNVFRGKSPIYKEGTNSYILNQKCNKWNYIDKQYMKSVEEKWLSNVKSLFFTKEGDVLINSTGEGTIGRSSYISFNLVNLLYDSHVLLLRLKQTINPQYFVYYFNSSMGQSQVNKVKSAQATKQTELGIENLCKICIPLPPKSIQNEIVEHINSEKETIKKIKAEAEKLRKEALTEFEKSIFE